MLRSETFVSELKGLNVSRTSVPVIGGHSGVTILPLLSQVQYAEWKEEEIAPLTKRIQNAGTEVVEAKAGGGSATLSMAQAARFARSLVKGLSMKLWLNVLMLKVTVNMHVSLLNLYV